MFKIIQQAHDDSNSSDFSCDGDVNKKMKFSKKRSPIRLKPEQKKIEDRFSDRMSLDTEDEQQAVKQKNAITQYVD